MAPTHPVLVFSSDTDRRALARAQRRGELVRLAAGIYTSDTLRSPEVLVRQHLWTIIAHEMPGAVISDRSARDGGIGPTIYVVAERARPLELPGARIVPRKGVGAQPGDMKLPGGLSFASEARALLDNLAATRINAQGSSRTLTKREVEEWVDEICAQRGDSAMNALRDQARQLAPGLDRGKELETLTRIISAALTTHRGGRIKSPILKARAGGAPVDARRLRLFARLCHSLSDLAPESIPDLPADRYRRTLLPFYEAYFSNYIEGTEFTLDEAAAIVFDDVIPPQRPQDAHDILGTYRVTSSRTDMTTTPSTSTELLDLLTERHAVVMGGRPQANPGRFKDRANRAGSTEFVAPELVAGTLHRGFDISASLISPFARAAYLMFLVSEVHPFTDGNGRLARLMMNAELVKAGEVPIIIPTVFRSNYLAALKAATHGDSDQPLIAALTFARRWTARINFADRSTAKSDLTRTHALRDSLEAQDAGIRLELP